MNFTNPEKLILVMLAEIHEKLGIDNGVDAKLVTNAIHSDNTWALSWEMPGIVGDSPDTTPPEVAEVVDVLDMWSFIEDAYSNLGESEKARIKTDAAPFGEHVRFHGFDGNNEARLMNIANFVVKEMDRFAQFKGRDFNSHCPSIDTYRRMLGLFRPIRATLMGQGLRTTDLVEILKAQLWK